MQAPTASAPAQSTFRTVFAGLFGNLLEWFDYAVFGFLVGPIGAAFFPADNPQVQTLKAWGLFAVGMLAATVVLLLHRRGVLDTESARLTLGALVTVPLAVLLDARLDVRGAGVGPFAASLLGAGFGVAVAAPAAVLAGVRHEDRRLVAAGAFPSPTPTIASSAIVA